MESNTVLCKAIVSLLFGEFMCRVNLSLSLPQRPLAFWWLRGEVGRVGPSETPITTDVILPDEAKKEDNEIKKKQPFFLPGKSSFWRNKSHFSSIKNRSR